MGDEDVVIPSRLVYRLITEGADHVKMNLIRDGDDGLICCLPSTGWDGDVLKFSGVVPFHSGGPVGRFEIRSTSDDELLMSQPASRYVLIGGHEVDVEVPLRLEATG